METIIGIENAEFYAYHGYYREERQIGNKFLVDLTVVLKKNSNIQDDLLNTVNYETLYNICNEEMKNTQKLLETVVLNIACRIKQQCNNIKRGSVKVQKISPQLQGKVGRTFVQITF